MEKSMDVEAVVSIVIRKLTDLLIQEPIFFNTAIDKIEQVRISLRQMQSFLIGAEDKKEPNEGVRVDKFLAVVYEVEDAIETFVLRKIYARKMGCFCIPRNSKTNSDLRKKIEGIEDKIKNLDKSKMEMEGDSNQGEPLRSRQLTLHRSSYRDEGLTLNQQNNDSSYSVDEETDLIGFKKGKSKLVAILTGKDRKSWDYPKPPAISVVGKHGSGKTTLPRAIDNSPEVKSCSDFRVISVVGMRGSGKTTLAKAVYKSPEVKRHFDCRAWVLASGNLTDVLLSTLEQIFSSIADKKSTKEELIEKIRMILQEKRYLVVLDDFQMHSAWKELVKAFPDRKKGSRVMLTTLDHGCALSVDTRGEPYQLKLLNNEDTWKLFLKKVCLPDKFSKEEILQLKTRIIRICKGLPLAIVVVGGLLSTKEASYELWLNVLEHLSCQLDSGQVQISNILDGNPLFNFRRLNIPKDKVSNFLAQSLKELPFHLRPCFLYFRLFPKDYDIPLRRLLRLWLAEGFVKQTPGMTPEDTVEIYLEELVKRSMIQISKKRKDGSSKTCRMLGAFHDDSNILSRAQEIGLFHTYQKPELGNPKHGVRRFADYVDTEVNPPMNIQCLRTYLSFKIQKNDMPATEIDGFLNQVIGQKFGLLRVLDLERVYKPKLPDNIGKLFFLLRYLGLRWTFLDTLPHSVGELPYLETLDVKHTYISSLPSSIWKMKHLRHLCLNEIRLDMYSQKHGSSLTHLQTLWGLFVDKTLVKNGLYRLINLRKLSLTCHISFQELDEWIARLASLQSLKIRSKYQNGQHSNLNLKPLSSLENLTHLYLLGSLPELHDRYEFPPKLTVLTLSISKLKEDPMPILAQLPSLSVLRLLADSYTGKELKCPPKGFIKLRILKLWMLKNLETCEVGEEALHNLQELEIRCCNKLQEFPNKLLSLNKIEKIVLTNMPQKFVKNAQEEEEKLGKILIFPETLQF